MFIRSPERSVTFDASLNVSPSAAHRSIMWAANDAAAKRICIGHGSRKSRVSIVTHRFRGVAISSSPQTEKPRPRREPRAGPVG